MTAPTLSGLITNIIFTENTVNAAPQLLDTLVDFSDIDGDFDGGSLTVSGVLAEDTVSVQNQGFGPGEISLSGTTVFFGGVAIGTLAGGAGTDLEIIFNVEANSASIDALIQNLTYANNSDTPTENRALIINITDANGDDLGVPVGAPDLSVLEGAANPFDGIDVGNNAAPTFVDIDDDGDLDMVVGSTFGTVALRVYQNNGAAGYAELTGVDNPFDGIGFSQATAPTFVDIDGDGDLDAVVGAWDGTLRVYENNDGDTGFTELTGADNPLAGIDAGAASDPTFADLDGDGDLDIVVGTRTGELRTYINNGGDNGYTEAIGADNPFDGLDDILQYGSAPAFVDLDSDGDLDLVTGWYFGRPLFYDNNDDDDGFTLLTGYANPFADFDLVSDSAPSFVDIDGDGDLDVVIGLRDGTIVTYENTTPHGQTINVTVTAENDGPVLKNFAKKASFDENTVNEVPQFLDTSIKFSDPTGGMDGGVLTLTGLLAEDTVSIFDNGDDVGQIGLDGTTVTFGGLAIATLSGGAGSDLIITFNANASSAAIDALIQNLTYANSSHTPTEFRDLTLNVTDADGYNLVEPSFSELEGADNPLSTLGKYFGYYSVPALIDLDGDGDMDVVVGNSDGTISFFDNNDADDGFTELTGLANPFDNIDVERENSPTFVDLDGDGDLDLVIGTRDGTIHTFDNNDNDSGFTELSGTDNPFDGVDVGWNSKPTFVDLDGDGDLDAVFGGQSGKLLVYDNNDDDAGFTKLTGAANPFDGFDIGRSSAPTFVDLDGDGDLDLVIGDHHGNIAVFDNNNADDGFTQLIGSDNPFDGVNVTNPSTPAFGDIDGDGDLDMVIRGNKGKLLIYENNTLNGKVITVKVVAEDDPTTLTELISSLSVPGETATDLDISGMTLADLDDNPDFTLTLSVDSGTLSAASNGAVTITGSGTGELILTGLASDIDEFLNLASAVQYAGADDVSGNSAALLVLTANDGNGDVVLGNVSIDIGTIQSGSESGDVLVGNDGADYIVGENGEDQITGVDGADTLSGGNGNDTVDGGDGDDLINGGTGNDRLNGSTGEDVLKGAAGHDRLNGGADKDVLIGGTGDDTLLGGHDDDRLNGNDGDDVLKGGSGADTLSGGNDNDMLLGDAGDDRMLGGRGDDVLNGGAGQDLLIGGKGSDVFVFDDVSDSTIAAPDKIRQFSHGEDLIDLSASAFNGLTFIGETEFSGTGSAELSFYDRGASLWVLVDVDGDGIEDMRFVLSGVTTLHADDFLL